MERGSRKNPHCLRRSRVVRILGFRVNILAELSEALNFWFFWFKPKEQYRTYKLFISHPLRNLLYLLRAVVTGGSERGSVPSEPALPPLEAVTGGSERGLVPSEPNINIEIAFGGWFLLKRFSFLHFHFSIHED